MGRQPEVRTLVTVTQIENTPTVAGAAANAALPAVVVHELNAWYGERHVIADVSMNIAQRQVTAAV